ncbi:formyl-coenzyme A transferase, partial [Aureobasidium melanogenum]
MKPSSATLRRPALLALESAVKYSQFKTSRRCKATAASPANPDGPLKGIRILDFGRILAGPFCTQILADYGADVIKIEQPGIGDETRSWKGKEEATAWKPDIGPMSFYFASVNRNKRSMTLDLKKPEALDIVHKLVKESDVVIENFVPGGADKLGIGYAAMSKINPRLIYASVSGYGSGGPYANRAGYDAIAAAEGGLMHITGAAGGGPVRPGLGMTDMSTGLYTHGAIMAALLHRAKTGKGQYISASLFETQLSLLINVGANWLNMGIDGKRWGAAHPSIVPYNTWKCKDDVWLTVAANNDKQYQKLCRIIDRDNLAEDPRYATNTQRIERRSEMEEIFEAVFAAKTSQEWLKLLDGTGLAHGQVNTIQRAFEHPQAVARDMVQDLDWDAVQSGEWKGIGPAVKFSESKASIRSRPPVLGEHTDDVLAEAGYGSEEIQRLREQGAI